MRKVLTDRYSLGEIKLIKILPVLAFVLFTYINGAPQGLSSDAWTLLVIFLATIMSVMLKLMSNGVIALIAMTACILTKTLTINQVLSSFSNSVVWLIIISFFIAIGVKVTGLGKRIAYWLISILGKSNLGLAYSLVLTEFLLSPLIPSSTARGVGVIFPIINAILEDHNKNKVCKKFSAFIIKVCFQTNLITSAMFVTSFVGNPLIVAWMSQEKIQITWTDWAVATLVPGIINLIIMPIVIYFTYRPKLSSYSAVATAKDALKKLGKITNKEKMMVFTFLAILTLWILGNKIGIHATTAALIGLCIMLVVGIIKWQDCIKESSAWEMMFWFGPLLMMTKFLINMGVPKWLVNYLQNYVTCVNWPISLAIVLIFYFYIHYFFTSVTSKVSALYMAMFALLQGCGVPPMLAVMALAVTSSLGGSLTNFGTGTAPVYYGIGYISTSQWFQKGFIFSTINLIIWTIVCYFWWYLLDYY